MDVQKAKEMLQTFKELYDDGLISEAEFTAKKQEILKVLGTPSSPAPKVVTPNTQPSKAVASPVMKKPPTPPPVTSPAPKPAPKPAPPKQPQSSIDDALDDFISGMMTDRFSVATTPSYLAPKNVATMSGFSLFF